MKPYIIAALLAGSALAGTAGQALAEKTLRVTVQVAVDHPVGANVVTFKEALEDLSGGEIEVEIYDSAQLFKGSEVPKAVASGAIDMGVVLADEYSGTVPAAGIFSEPFLFPSYEVLAKAAAPESPVRQTFDRLIGETGTRVLWWQDYGPVQILSKGHPIRTPADMKGKLVRALGKPVGDFIEAVGGTPVVMGGSEQFMAYQRGTVDIGMSGTTAVKSRKLYEVMDHVTMTNHSLAEFIVVINPATYDGLSDQERAWVDEAAQRAEADLRAKTRQQNEEAAAWLVETGNATVTELTPDEIAQWQKASAPAIDIFIKDAGATGQQLVDDIRALY
ncbi:C4-dicarboxylate ABC transporter substrate-binding protein [Rhodovulum sulfidophilum]|uniref:TRAP transporter substrate-binding protein DctP n=1 Tax=Rhodovulum visakhapatnamense TaxID=364297 RepID=A0ABS1RFQ6_9RHOB|nr:TRAP transporter substrate-binding protein DctP [Rhodovulum visakhapatnamense]MBL3568619.1 TRAP transporter substrate-binding protein DctP [Rhodovulum visakhapatnamense]MBL3578493.1 TRAP transporter substrate-binding protein DctP [Rhodovulum visakhapatnamense]OLS43818.1 C4-dicarboxylate ABC transporter substrate-binding protein [Rhodovulum sulfidophilum]